MRKMPVGLCVRASFHTIVPSGHAADEPPAGTEGRSAEFIMHGIAFPLGKSIEEIERTLGPQISRTDTAVGNRHVPGQIDHVHTLKYDGLEVSVYRASRIRRAT